MTAKINDGLTTSQRYVKRKIASYIAEHGAMPLCACGCGRTVNMRTSGSPAKYATYGCRTEQDRRGRAAKEANTRLAKNLDKGNIPREDFLEACRRLKAAKGWSWAELSLAGGYSETTLPSLVFDKRRKTFSKEWVTNFLKRVNGLPAPPTPYMLYEAEAEMNWDDTFRETIR